NRNGCSVGLTTYSDASPASRTHLGSFFTALDEAVHNPRRPMQSTGSIARAFLSSQCQAPLLAHLLSESLMQSLRLTTPTMHSTGKITKALFRGQSLHVFCQDLARIPLWTRRRVNQQRSTVVGPPRAILDILPKS